MTTKTFYIETAFGKIPAILYTPAVKKLDVCVVFFHGRGENGTGTLEADGLQKLVNNTNHKNLLDKAEYFGFSILAPQFVQSIAGWAPGWTNQYIEPIIDYALANLTRLLKVGITGLSQGGGACWLAMTNPKTAPKIFACLSICPTPQYDGDFSQIAKNKIAVWNFHAKDDTTVGVASSRNMVAKANAYNPTPSVKYDELTAGNHYIWSAIYNRNDAIQYILDYIPAGAAEPVPPTDEIVTAYAVKTTIYKSGKIVSIKL